MADFGRDLADAVADRLLAKLWPRIEKLLTGQNSAPDKYLSEKEAAEYLRCKRRTLQTTRLRGNGPPYMRIGQSTTYRLSDLEAWVKENQKRSRAEEVR